MTDMTPTGAAEGGAPTPAGGVQLSRPLLAVLLLWPVVLAVLILVGMTITARVRQLPLGVQGARTPAKAVEALWQGEAQATQHTLAQPGFAMVQAQLTTGAAKYLREKFMLIGDRRINGVKMTGSGEARVDATLTAYSGQGGEKNLDLHVTYYLEQERGRWKVQQAQLTCPSCNGDGTLPCGMCGGAGHAEGSTEPCPLCGVTGHIACMACDSNGVSEVLDGMLLREFRVPNATSTTP